MFIYTDKNNTQMQNITKFICSLGKSQTTINFCVGGIKDL